MSTAVLEREPRPEAQGAVQGRAGLRLIVLARIACEEGATRPELARELAAFVGDGLQARIGIDREVANLVRAGHAIESRARFTASPDGLAFLLDALAMKGLPRTWAELRDIRLVAKALGIEAGAPLRIKGLAKPETLRAEILAGAYGLSFRGAPSSSKLRAALALVALERAFGNRIKAELTAGAGLNAKASRVLAGQLLKRPRDAGTDKRLVALLAAEAVGSELLGADQLRVALLRRLAGSAVAGGERERERPRTPVVAPSAPPLIPAEAMVPALEAEAPSARPAAASRPDLPGFVKIVQAIAAGLAEGWPGNRKALVARVYDAIAAAHPGWGLSIVEFKAMLAECHRIGHLALVTADLKDKRLLDELRRSAISYKNTVWHLVRVED